MVTRFESGKKLILTVKEVTERSKRNFKAVWSGADELNQMAYGLWKERVIDKYKFEEIRDGIRRENFFAWFRFSPILLAKYSLPAATLFVQDLALEKKTTLFFGSGAVGWIFFIGMGLTILTREDDYFKKSRQTISDLWKSSQ